MATSRLDQIKSHLNSPAASARERLLQQSPDDVVVCAAVRTPLTKARKGGLAKAPVDLMLSTVLKEVVARSKVDPKLIDDIIVGSVLTPGGGGASVARMASLRAGIPNTVSIATTNRQCASGLQAVSVIANAIKTGQIDIGIGGGVESMTLYHFNRYQYRRGNTDSENDLTLETLSVQEAADCLIPMGITSENVAAKYNVSRERQDAFAAHSTTKAVAAQEAGHFKAEIAPVTLPDGAVVTIDDGIRKGTTPEVLAKLKPVFKKDGSTTAGNSSQLTDGAAAVLLTRRSKALELGLPIIGKFGGFTAAGVPPNIMGIGPAVAIPKLFEKFGLTYQDVDFFEINEAFASQAVMSVDTLNIPHDKVNPNGGAIAFGHPLGCTGARQLATAFSHAKRTGQKVFVTSMCVGSGMGCASVFVSEQ
ncbi:putative acetyl-CoA C-acyltransferase [Meredithblackwellia eburnea MCA 4105]